MFAPRYFARRYFPARYFPAGGSTPAPPSGPDTLRVGAITLARSAAARVSGPMLRVALVGPAVRDVPVSGPARRTIQTPDGPATSRVLTGVAVRDVPLDGPATS